MSDQLNGSGSQTPATRPAEQVYDVEDDAMGPPPGMILHYCGGGGTYWHIPIGTQYCPHCGSPRGKGLNCPLTDSAEVPFSPAGRRVVQAVIAASGSGTLSGPLAAFRPDLARCQLVDCVDQLGSWLEATRKRLDETTGLYDLREHDEVGWVGPVLRSHLLDMLIDRSTDMGTRLREAVLNEFFSA